MCRYSGKIYKSHYVCFRCRKSFKQASTDDILLRIKKEKIYHESDGQVVEVGNVFSKSKNEELLVLRKKIDSREIKCPECGNLMADLGKDFKAPKKTAVKEWEITEGLFRIGKCFYSCGCNGIGYIPQNPNDFEHYLKNILKDYENSLVKCQNKTKEELPEKEEYLTYWAEKISNIKAEMVLQKINLV